MLPSFAPSSVTNRSSDKDRTLCVPVVRGVYTPTDSADDFITLLRKPVVVWVLEHDAVSIFIWDMQSVRYQAGAGEADDRQ